MSWNPQMTQPVGNEARPGGLAVASLVLGILSCMLSLLVVGGLFGLAGLVLGLVYVSKRRGRNGLAWWGVGLSIAGILASVSLGSLYYRFLTSGAGSQSSMQVWEGVAAPDIAVTTIAGETIRLSELKGRRVILDFWATWCGPCVVEIPHFIRLAGETTRDELVVIGVSNENEETLSKFAAKHAMNYHVASASGLPSPYRDIRAIPTTFFLDRNGVIRTVVVGSRGYAELKRHALAPDVPGEPKPPPAAVSAPGSGK
jgi:peroxiredoxin